MYNASAGPAAPVVGMLAGRASRALVRIDQALGSDVVSAEDKRRLKAATVLFASVLLDNDFVPMDNSESFNMGTANMPVQQENYREMYVLYLASHPMVAGRVERVAGNARGMLLHTVNDAGAHMGSLHYVGASNGPLLATLQQLEMPGVYNAFRDEPRLARFAEFHLQALTPPEVRLGDLRKMPAIGDGATKGTGEHGMLGTGFAATRPELSARLMRAWREQGRLYSGLHGTTLLKIDERLPGVTPNLGDACFPGYFSVLRSGWGTPQENALWCVNGNAYSDHAHSDLGSVVLQALGAPLSVDWGSFHYPSASGGVMHSTVILLRDTFNGAEAGSTKIWSPNLMAQGPVQTPAGSMLPPPRTSGVGKQELLSAGPVFSLSPGVDRLSFTGQDWRGHPTGGIDWDLYLLPQEEQQAQIGNWAHTWSSCAGEFQAAQRRPFEERQHLQRVRGTGPFTAVILPWPKGQRPEGLAVTLNGQVVVRTAAGALRLSLDGKCEVQQ